MHCMRCDRESTLYFRLVDNLDGQTKWCPQCVLHWLDANRKYMEGEFKGDQDKHVGK